MLLTCGTLTGEIAVSSSFDAAARVEAMPFFEWPRPHDNSEPT
ncbi:hypothetical protein OCAR_4319 [Afipia carboxidovorans OM5]|nr:hypothetical protein OCAR_4319 [Afipia carboxidovorans OM5]